MDNEPNTAQLALLAVAVATETPIDQQTAAAHLRCSIPTLQKHQRQDPTFPVHRMADGETSPPLYFRSELNTWLRNRREQRQAGAA